MSERALLKQNPKAKILYAPPTQKAGAGIALEINFFLNTNVFYKILIRFIRSELITKSSPTIS